MYNHLIVPFIATLPALFRHGDKQLDRCFIHCLDFDGFHVPLSRRVAINTFECTYCGCGDQLSDVNGIRAHV